MGRKLTTEEFIVRSSNAHHNFYGYSKVEYRLNNSKVTITCPTHGDFDQLPFVHMQGGGCKLCANQRHPGSINDTRLGRDESLAGSEYNFYYVKLTNKDSGKTFWKVGIEKYTGSRWPAKNSKKYESEYLINIKGTLRYCFELEQQLCKEHNTGVTLADWPHDGHTEMLPYDFLGDTNEL